MRRFGIGEATAGAALLLAACGGALAGQHGDDDPAAGALAIAGDPAYGEYLAGACVTCHQPSGRADGIPSIVGWPEEAFVRALVDYRAKTRDHAAMQMIASDLGDEEIAALAAYFGALSPP